MISRRMFCAGASMLALSVTSTGAARANAPVVKIGVLTDMSGPLSAVLGEGSVDGTRMAIEDFGGSVGDMKIELLYADHQGKADVSSGIARRWIDEENVDLILDLGNSAAAIAAQKIVEDKNKIIIVTGASSSDITGKYCNRNSFHWGYETYMQSAAVAAELTRGGGDTWFFITADYAYGHALEADAQKSLEAVGGKVVGSVKHPANTHDFSSLLLQAQNSGAKMVGIASAGDDLERIIKQGAEFGNWQTQKAAAFGLQLYNVPAIGLEPMEGILHNSIFYWDRNDDTRKLSRRFWERNGKPPAETHAVNYSATTQYLKAISEAGSKDTDAVLAALHKMPVNDVVSPDGHVRADGRLIRPTHIVRVKKAADVKETWDCLEVVTEIPGDLAYRPVADSACPLLKS